MKKTDDNFYIEKILKGNVSFYSYLVDKYKNMALTLALRIIRNREDAEEAIQDAFLKAYHSLSEFKFESGFSTWLYRIVYTTAISKTRKTKFELNSIEDNTIDELDFDKINDGLKNLRSEEQRKYINEVLESLPEDESAIMTFYYLNENSVDEISKITGLTKSNIKIKLLRARNKFFIKLKSLLKEEMFELL
jgi:RNA polymerase sigma factor (sigma-70 family)